MGFKLVRVDSTEPYKVILRLGSHLIGRGKLLDCNDIRVSRNHAELIVTFDSILLKSLHQNPCFLRRKVPEGTVIFSQPDSHVLGNGDQFGLTPEHYWYEVIEMPEDNLSPSIDSQEVSSKPVNGCLNQDATRSDSTTQSYVHEPLDEDQSCSQSVLDQVFDAPFDLPPENQAASLTQVQNGLSKPDSFEHMDTSHTENLQSNVQAQLTTYQSEPNEPNNLCETPSIRYQFENDSPSPSHNIATSNAPVEINQNECNSNHINTTSNKMSFEDELPPEDEAIDPVQQPVASEQTDKDPNKSPSKRLHSENDSPTNVKRIKTEPETPSNENKKDVSNEARSSNRGIKKEPDSPQDVKPGPSNVQGPSNAGTNNGPNMPPSPMKPMNNLPRERCWYGATCYRKNPAHKAQFSHPCDADWGSGPQGVCPWGSGCLRRDPRHWRDHTHPPGARPPHLPPRGLRPGIAALAQRRLDELYDLLNEACAGLMNANGLYYRDEDSDDDSVDNDYEF